MENAIDRLAVELMKLPAHDWERLVELRRASQPDESAVMKVPEGTHRAVETADDAPPRFATVSGHQT